MRGRFLKLSTISVRCECLVGLQFHKHLFSQFTWLPLSSHIVLLKNDYIIKLHWSWWSELNQQPTDYRSVTLPIELHQRIGNEVPTVHNLSYRQRSETRIYFSLEIIVGFRKFSFSLSSPSAFLSTYLLVLYRGLWSTW